MACSYSTNRIRITVGLTTIQINSILTEYLYRNRRITNTTYYEMCSVKSYLCKVFNVHLRKINICQPAFNLPLALFVPIIAVAVPSA